MTPDAVPGRFAYNEDHEAFRQTVRVVPAEGRRAQRQRVGEEPARPQGILAQGGRDRDAVPDRARGIWRAGARFRLQRDRRRGDVVYRRARRLLAPVGHRRATISKHYGSEEQKQQWLPRLVSGETITAIAMTEPGTGSATCRRSAPRAKKDGNHYVVNGSKTYITNGQNADLVLVVAKTDPDAKPAYKGMSIILVEADREGFKRGRKLDKIGQDAADTSELFFEDVRVPMTNCLGEEGKGFIYLMSQLPQERLSIAVGTQAVGAEGVRRDGRVHQDAQGVRRDGVRFPEHALRARRPQGQAAGRLGASRLGDPRGI